MGPYSKYILPKLVKLACSSKPNMRQRDKVVPLAKGNVLEIGVGPGLNFPYYDANKVTKLWALDPSPEMTKLAKKAARSLPFDVELIGLPGEEIPLENDSVDTVLITYTLCTIPDTQAALREMARVLRAGGMVALVVPDYLRCGIDFYQWDYTHALITTSYRIRQVLDDAGFEVFSIVHFTGALTGPIRLPPDLLNFVVHTRLAYWLLASLGLESWLYKFHKTFEPSFFVIARQHAR